MKKLIASILCACTISSLLVGCGSTSDQADQAGDTTAETQTDAEKCIKCCACVKSCTQQARVYDTPFAVLLSQCFTRQKDPKTIL